MPLNFFGYILSPKLLVISAIGLLWTVIQACMVHFINV